jgi:hypothetical protein
MSQVVYTETINENDTSELDQVKDKDTSIITISPRSSPRYSPRLKQISDENLLASTNINIEESNNNQIINDKPELLIITQKNILKRKRKYDKKTNENDPLPRLGDIKNISFADEDGEPLHKVLLLILIILF